MAEARRDELATFGRAQQDELEALSEMEQGELGALAGGRRQMRRSVYNITVLL